MSTPNIIQMTQEINERPFRSEEDWKALRKRWFRKLEKEDYAAVEEDFYEAYLLNFPLQLD
jgi:hypothetical protein